MRMVLTCISCDSCFCWGVALSNEISIKVDLSLDSIVTRRKRQEIVVVVVCYLVQATAQPAAFQSHPERLGYFSAN